MFGKKAGVSLKEQFKAAAAPHHAAAHRFAVQRCRETPLYTKEVFDQANQAVRDAIEHLSPSGSNGRVDAAGTLIAHALREAGVDPNEYWADVWLRSGKKDFDDWNDAHKGAKRGQARPAENVDIAAAAAEAGAALHAVKA